MSPSGSAPEPSPALHARERSSRFLGEDRIHAGDARDLMHRIEPESVALSIWWPPYFVGKSYERELSFGDWTKLIRAVVGGHVRTLIPGGFVAINIADVLCFADEGIFAFRPMSCLRSEVRSHARWCSKPKRGTRGHLATSWPHSSDAANRRLTAVSITTTSVAGSTPLRRR